MALATTANQFVELLHKSQLVDNERYEAALKAAGGEAPSEPKEMADLLIKQGVLTPFQASLLINGKWRGFFIANGKYKLLQLLGVGGMGKVYLCEHIRMKRLVALKVLPFDQLKDEDAVARFTREAVAAAALNHPNIVKAYDLDQDGSLHFLVLEYVDGSSLHEIIKKHGPMEIARACHYIAQASLGLQHAHEAGWVHRDIKPGNLLLDRGGTVKLLDMGLARLFQAKAASDELTQRLDRQPVLGTADYLSPEQALNSSDVDIRADIYSMGATLYYLLAGRAPFERGTITEKLLAHQQKDPDPITDLRPDVPPALVTVLKKMMAKKPVHRFQTPAAIADAMAPWASGPIEPPAAEEMPKRCLALEALASGTPSGPITGAHYRSNGVAPRAATAPSTSSHLLRKGMSPIKWLSAPERRTPVVVVGGIGVGSLGVGLFVGLYLLIVNLFFSEKPADPPPMVKSPTVTPPPPVAVTAKPPPPVAPSAGAITPQDAATRVGEKVTVEFPVAGTGTSKDGALVFLNSSANRASNNFTIVLQMRKLESAMREAGITEPKVHYNRKTVRVTGTVALYLGAPQIVVEDLKQIEDMNK